MWRLYLVFILVLATGTVMLPVVTANHCAGQNLGNEVVCEVNHKGDYAEDRVGDVIDAARVLEAFAKCLIFVEPPINWTNCYEALEDRLGDFIGGAECLLDNSCG